MFQFFSDLKNQFAFKHEHPNVDSAAFGSLKVATVASLLSCMLVTAKTYIGDNINCVTGFEKNEHKAIETYCFISSTFSLVNLTDANAPYPGLGPMPIPHEDGGAEDPLKRHAYYQWVPLMLAVQTAVLMTPHWFWKNAIDKMKFKSILCGLDKLHLNDEEASDKLVRKSVEYATRSLGCHSVYGSNFVVCELVASVVALGNLFVTDAFLGGEFFNFGEGALGYLFGDATDIDNPLNQVFPKVTKCTWHKFGPTGSIQSFDSLCVLPLNIANEKTYVMLWCVYIVTTALVLAVTFWHLVLALSKSARNFTMTSRLRKRDVTKQYFNSVKDKLHYGDWFIIHHLCKKMLPKYFEKWMQYFSEEINK